MKDLLKLGKILNKKEQKTINGGAPPTCPGCSTTEYWIYMDPNNTGPGAACVFASTSGYCYGFASGAVCCL